MSETIEGKAGFSSHFQALSLLTPPYRREFEPGWAEEVIWEQRAPPWQVHLRNFIISSSSLSLRKLRRASEETELPVQTIWVRQVVAEVYCNYNVITVKWVQSEVEPGLIGASRVCWDLLPQRVGLDPTGGDKAASWRVWLRPSVPAPRREELLCR